MVVDIGRVAFAALGAMDTAIQQGSKRGEQLVKTLRKYWEDSEDRTSPVTKSTDHEFSGGYFTDSDRVISTWGPDAYTNMPLEDPVIAGDLKRRITEIVSRPLLIEPVEKRPTSKQREIAQFCQDNIDELGRQNKRVKTNALLQMYELVKHALVSGYAIGDPVMVWDKAHGRWWLDYIGWRKPTDFEFDCDDYGRMLWIRDVLHGKKHDPADLIVASWLPFLQNWYGTKELRPIFRAYRLKDLAFKQWAIFIQKAASGSVYGRYPDQKARDENYKLDLINAGKKLASDIFSVFPESAKIEQFKTDATPAQVWQWCIDSCNREIHAGLLNLNLDSSSSQGGGLNQGGYSEKVALQEAGGQLLVRFIEDVVSKEIVERLCNANVDVSAGNFRYPRARLDVTAKLDPTAVATRLQTLFTIFPGAKVDPAWVNANCGVQLLNTEPLVGQVQSPAAVSFAKLSADASRVAKDWKQIDRSAEKLIAALEEPYLELIDWAKANQQAVMDGEWMPGGKTRLELFRSGLTDSAAVGVRAIADTKPVKLAADPDEAWAYEEFVPEAAIDALRNEIGDTYWRDFEKTIQDEFRQIIEDGMRDGLSNEEIANLMAQAAGTAAVDAKGDPVPENNWRMRRTARQANAESYNHAKATAGQRAAWIDGYTIIGPRDGRWTDLCEYLTGKSFRKTDPGLRRPTYHWGCRRTVMPVMDGEPGLTWSEWKDIPQHLIDQDLKFDHRFPPAGE